MLEYFWYILASVLAGVGTGLVGLSAATVMVPILIVLCPSFAEETGAYQATAIALASDILGSAVTTATYIRHKNIDLRRGWIMLACIIGMCTVGSFAAWRAGNVVLGGFTLILTFCIGIRFLVKPTTERMDTAAKGAALDWKGVAISLLFGLTIGFGTGFVGSGGGMMMLVVFTAFLGMELKPAVGTSTFIMTFTALIASVSHILIHPAILLERWPVLILCMTVATAASLASARFANRVDSRTVGLVTGVVLTLLGGALILLHYWDFVAAHQGAEDTVLVYSSDTPERVREYQRLGAGKVAALLEGITARLARRAVEAGYTRIISAGGETSGAVTKGLGFQSYLIGPSVAPGVPVMVPAEAPGIRLVLKSGNFGGEDFFGQALEITGEKGI